MSQSFSRSRALPPRQGAGDDDAGETAKAPEYSFDGYTVELSQKIALTPFTAHHRQHARRDDEKPDR